MSDLSSFSLTCSFIRPVAIRQMLRTSHVCLTWADQIRLEQFHFFLFADVSARAPHVRTLKIVCMRAPRITVGRSDIDHVSLIIDVLTSCSHVEAISLVLADDPTFTPYDNRALIDVVAKMQRLRSLSVRCLPDDALALVRAVPFNLRKLMVHSRVSAFQSISWSLGTLQEVLPRFAPTLEELAIGTIVVDPEDIQATQNITPPSVFNMTQYPGVRSLSIESLLPQPFLDNLQHLFPALDGTLRIGEPDEPLSEDADLDGIRATNQRVQEIGRNGSRARAWTRVDRVICSAQMLYMLGLRCPVRFVRLSPCSSDALQYATSSLRENPVPHLTLSLLLAGLLQGFNGLFSAELGGTLTHLSLQLLYFPRGSRKLRDRNDAAVPRFQWSYFLDRIVSALRPLQRLTHLRIAIISSIHYYSDVASTVQSNQFLRTVHGPSFDLEGSAAALAAPLPALRYLFVDTRSHFTNIRNDVGPHARSEDVCAARGWRVGTPAAETGHQEGGPVLVQLSKGVVERIVRSEELILYENEYITAK